MDLNTFGGAKKKATKSTLTSVQVSLHGLLSMNLISLARMFHELMSRDRGDGCATEQPQGVGSEAYLNSTSQDSTPEDARKDDHNRGRSRQLVKHPGSFKSGDSPPPLLLYKRYSFTLSRLNDYRLFLIYEASQTLTPRTVSQLANSLFLNLSYAFLGDTETFTYGLQGLGGPAIDAKSGLEDSFFSA